MLRASFGVRRSVLLLLGCGVLAILCLAGAPLAAQSAYLGQQLGGGFNGPNGVAVDGSGNVYVADYINSAVKEIPVGCTSSSCVSTLGGGFIGPSGVAVDGSGNVYVADSAVKEIPVGCTSSSCVRTLGGGFSAPNSVAVDGSSNVYVADFGNNAVKEIPVGCTSSGCVRTLGGGFSGPLGVAVDGSGNIYVADYNNSAVKEMPAACTSSSCVTTLGGGFSNPNGVAVDGGGNVYIADFGNNAVKEMPAACTSSSCVTTLGGGFSRPAAVAVDGSGNVYVGDLSKVTVQAIVRHGVSFPSINVGSSESATLTFTIWTGGAIGKPRVLTQGATGLDFTDAGTGTCTTINGAGHPYSANATCTVNVTFAPKYAGTRYGAVELTTTSGTVIATAYVYGTGKSSQLVFNAPLTPSTLGGGFSFPPSVAVDSSGNVYVADYENNAVKEMPAACTSSSCVTTLGGGFSSPYGVAVDGSGNVYVADFANNAVKEIPVGCTSSSCVSTLGGSLNSAFGVAVDGSGNVYFADYSNNAVREIPVGCTSSSCVSTLGGGFNAPAGVAVDASGNVYVADSNNGSVKEMPASCTSSSCVSPLGGGFGAPFGVAVDGSGNVYVGDFGDNAVKEIPAGCTSSSCVSTLGEGFINPNGVAVDGSGNVYVADYANNAVKAMTRATPPTVTFTKTTTDGNTDSAEGTRTVTVQNIGNQPLVFAIPTVNGTTNPTTAPDFTFTTTSSSACPSLTPTAHSTATLAAGATCNVPLTFTPVAPSSGALTESLVFTDNALNATGATQSVTLKGTAILVVAASSVNSTVAVLPNPAVAGSTATATVTLKDASGNGINGATAIFSSTSTTVSFGTPSVSGNVITVTMTDTAAETAPISVTLGGAASGTLSGAEQFFAPAYVVTVATDPIAANESAAHCVATGITGNNANCSLREAVDAANALTGVTTNIGFSGAAVGTAGNPAVIQIAQSTAITLTASMNLNGPGANLLTIEGGTTPLSSANKQVFSQSSGNVTLSGVTVANGYASSSGGGWYQTGGTLTLTNSTFSGNQAQVGGAIYALSSLTVTNSTFSGNKALVGGAISATSLTLTNSTFSGNSASGGGGAIDASGLTVTNSVFSGDSAPSYSGIDSPGTYANVLNDSAHPDTFPAGTSVLSGPANLSALGSYGGPTQTFLPLPGSAAICAGVSESLNSVAITADQRGVPIPTTYGSTKCYDIGAVQTEYALAGPLTVPSPVTLGTTVSPAPTVSLTENGTPLTSGTATVTLTDTDSDLSSGASSTNSLTTGVVTFGSVQFASAETTDQLTATLSLNPATPVSLTVKSNSFQVGQLTPLFAFAPSPNSQTYGTAIAAGSLDATASYGGNPVAGTFSYTATSTTTNQTTVLTAGSTVLPADTYTLTATFTPMNPALYKSGLTVQAGYTVGKASQAISLTTAPPASATYNTQFTVVATGGSSGIALGYASSGGCSNVGTAYTMTSGTTACTVTVSQAGNTNYAPAPNSISTVNANLAAPTLSFAAIPQHTYGDVPFNVSATSASTGSVSYSLVSGPAAVGSPSGLVTLTGAGTVKLSASQQATSNYTQAAANTQFTVLQQASITTLGLSSTSITPLQTVTLTATVAPTVAGSATPTGSVTFFDASTAPATQIGGSMPLVSGQAKLPGVSLLSGPHILYASYSSDTNYSASSSSIAASNITVAAEDFTFTATGFTTQSVVPGTAGIFTFQLAPLYDKYPGPVVFTVTGLPPGATYTVTPASIAPNAGPLTVTVTINTPQAIVMHTVGRSAPWALALLLPVFLLRRARSKLGHAVALALLLSAGAFALSGCGSNANGYFGQSVTNYTVTVTGTSGAMTHSSTITLQVQ